jgi:hypothetical protein
LIDEFSLVLLKVKKMRIFYKGYQLAINFLVKFEPSLSSSCGLYERSAARMPGQAA